MNHELKKELLKLDKVLKEKRPEYYQNLQMPLSDDEISKLEEQYEIKLPLDLKELYKWKNGQNRNYFKSLVNNCSFEPLEDVLSTNKEFTEMIGEDFDIKNWWNENWLPIFGNGGGDFICYDLKGVFTDNKRQLIEYWHSDEDRTVISPNLFIFIEKLTTAYLEKQLEKFMEDTFDISEELSTYTKAFIVDEEFE